MNLADFRVPSGGKRLYELRFAAVFLFGLALSATAQAGLDDLAVSLVNNDDIEFIQQLGSSGAEIDGYLKDGFTLLHLAAKQNNLDAAIALIERGANIDALDQNNGWTALMTAVYLGHREFAIYLRDQGAAVDVTGTDSSTVSILAEFSGMADEFTQSPVTDESEATQKELDQLLLMAAEAGNSGLVAELIDLGANPNALNKAGWRPVHYASYRLDADLLVLLHDKGAEVDVQPLNLVAAALLGSPQSGLSVQEKENFFSAVLSDRFELDLAINVNLARKMEIEDRILSLFRPKMNFGRIDFEIAKPLQDIDWVHAQKLFAEKGLYTGKIDGVLGPETKRAAIAYYAGIAAKMASIGVETCESGLKFIKGHWTPQSLYDAIIASVEARENGNIHGKGTLTIKESNPRIELRYIRHRHLFPRPKLIENWDIYFRINSGYSRQTIDRTLLYSGQGVSCSIEYNRKLGWENIIVPQGSVIVGENFVGDFNSQISFYDGCTSSFVISKLNSEGFMINTSLDYSCIGDFRTSGGLNFR